MKPNFARGAQYQEESALVVVRKPPGTERYCDMGCIAGQTQMARLATHVAWLIGRPTYLCTPCSKAFPKAYADALSNWAEEAVAA